MRKWLCFFLLVTMASASLAQDHWYLSNRDYFDPILAEPRAAQTSILFPASASSFPFAITPGRSLAWDISLGTEIPVTGYGTGSGADGPTGVAAGRFGVGLWFPLSFHMVEDMGKDASNPILNTDYRFSGMVKAQYGLRDRHSSHVGAKFQFGHESTHIGDEFTLGALRTHPTDFVRVNVSYEYYDLAGSYEPNIGLDGKYQFKVRAGDIWLWNPAKGWYDGALLQPYGNFIKHSHRNHEPYAQAEFYRQPDACAGCKQLGWIASADIRDRTIYQYLPANDANAPGAAEPTQISVNVMAGLRQVRSGPGTLGKISPTYYLRFYHGVNPNGQFRSQANFTEYGFGMLFSFW